MDRTQGRGTWSGWADGGLENRKEIRRHSERTSESKKKEDKAREKREVGVEVVELCHDAPALLPDTAFCYGPAVTNWYHTKVNNMNKTDVKKRLASSLHHYLHSLLIWKKKRDCKRCKDESLSYALLLPFPPSFRLFFALKLSLWFSSFQPSPRGCEAWLSTAAELSKLKGDAGGEEVDQADTR